MFKYKCNFLKLSPSLMLMSSESPGLQVPLDSPSPWPRLDCQAPLKQWLIKITKFYMLNIMWLSKANRRFTDLLRNPSYPWQRDVNGEDLVNKSINLVLGVPVTFQLRRERRVFKHGLTYLLWRSKWLVV